MRHRLLSNFACLLRPPAHMRPRMLAALRVSGVSQM